MFTGWVASYKFLHEPLLGRGWNRRRRFPGILKDPAPGAGTKGFLRCSMKIPDCEKGR
jgi:hypothetical protein